ncbi:hypothetical protein [Acidovorax sp. ACV01]|uniref:hypothetical protein n=1 Tax=Acidovorax sp. ACV01 TaxID=2769311 RepID=UPI00177E4614|nr:hypothetical protein [Acidovorax sp. ACV01]MBD9390968.1 hypothetical protein [Acidovorax sp. ACV01]
MCIKITVAQTVPDDAFTRIVALTQFLQKTDPNFEDQQFGIARGEAADVVVIDPEDKIREKLLHLLVVDAITADTDSVMGSLS